MESTLCRIAIQLEPGLGNGLIGPEEFEPGRQRLLPVQVFPVAYVVVDVGLELGFYVWELMLRDSEVVGDAVLFPDGPLSADGTVGATADQDSRLLRFPHEIHGQDAGRIAHFQRPIYIKTNQYDQVISSLLILGCSGLNCIDD